MLQDWRGSDHFMDAMCCRVKDYFQVICFVCSTHFWPMFPFYTPWKHQKTCGFLLFSRGLKMGTLARNRLITKVNSKVSLVFQVSWKRYWENYFVMFLFSHSQGLGSLDYDPILILYQTVACLSCVCSISICVILSCCSTVSKPSINDP